MKPRKTWYYFTNALHSWTKVCGHLVEMNSIRSETHPSCVRDLVEYFKIHIKYVYFLWDIPPDYCTKYCYSLTFRFPSRKFDRWWVRFWLFKSLQYVLGKSQQTLMVVLPRFVYKISRKVLSKLVQTRRILLIYYVFGFLVMNAYVACLFCCLLLLYCVCVLWSVLPDFGQFPQCMWLGITRKLITWTWRRFISTKPYLKAGTPTLTIIASMFVATFIERIPDFLNNQKPKSARIIKARVNMDGANAT